MPNLLRGPRRPDSRFWSLLGLLALLLPGCGSALEPTQQAGPAEPRVSFVIFVPPDTPPDAQIWLSGNHPVLGDWNGRGLEASWSLKGVCTVTASFPKGTQLEFKVTRGGWETVEKGEAGEEIQNRRLTVDGDVTAELSVAAWRDKIDEGPPSTLTGDIRLHRNVPSAHLRLDRHVIVYLPPGYADLPQKRYPVLYMHDGQNIFDRATSFLGIEWEVDETVERLIEAGEIEPLIVVGVYNTADRIHEYTQVPDPRRAGGGADDYGRFLVEELKPLIDATYRTRPERAETGVAGSSLGGLVSMYFALSLESTFSRIGVVSPAVWWANSDILDQVRDHGKTDSRVWVDIGTAEGGTGGEAAEAIVASARALRDVLIDTGWVLDQDLRYFEDAGAEHNEAAWAGRMEQILKFLFPPRAD